MATWMLVEQRRDGLWYAISTSDSPTAREDLTDWMVRNPWRHVQLRQATASDNEVQEMAESRAEAAKRDGLEFGEALYDLSGNGGIPNNAAAFAVGKRFSRLMGYVDLETGLSFIEGFTLGFRPHPPKQLDSPTEQ